MRTLGAICHQSLSLFLYGLVTERFTVLMLMKWLLQALRGEYLTYLAEPHSLRRAIQESHHGVFPISHMITNILLKNRRPIIKGVEVHIERVDMTITVIVHDDSSAHSAIGLARGIWLHSFQPCRVGSNVVHGCKIDTIASSSVQGVQIIQSQWSRSIWYNLKIDLWLSMLKLSPNIGGEKGILGLDPYQRGSTVLA